MTYDDLLTPRRPAVVTGAGPGAGIVASLAITAVVLVLHAAVRIVRLTGGGLMWVGALASIVWLGTAAVVVGHSGHARRRGQAAMRPAL